MSDRDAATLWIIDNQRGRRNLSAIDRIALEERREEIVKRMAKRNQKERKGNQPGATSAILPKLPVHTRAVVAKAAGVGERTYDATHGTFEAYCREKWGMSKRHCDRLISASETAERVGPVGPTPPTERVARPLTRLYRATIDSPASVTAW